MTEESQLIKLGIPNTSPFYEYIKRRIQIKMKIESIISTLEKARYNCKYALYELDALSYLNEKIITTRIHHNDFMQVYGSKHFIEYKLDSTGNIYMQTDDVVEADIDDLMKVNELHELILKKEITLARKKAKDILKRFESIYHMDEEMLRVSMTSERTDQINEASKTSVANRIHFKLKKPRIRT